MTFNLSLAWSALFKLSSKTQAAVSFNLNLLSQLATHDQVMSMCHLPSDIDLESFCSVALTPNGWILLRSDGSYLTSNEDIVSTTNVSLGSSFYQRFHYFHQNNGSLSVGVGSYKNLPAVSLVVDLVSSQAIGEAITARAVKPSDIILFPSIGVRLLEQSVIEKRLHRVLFSNRVQTHLDSADLNSYQRTGHCNLFFLRHCLVDSTISSGLYKAVSRRREAVLYRIINRLLILSKPDSVSKLTFRSVCNFPTRTQKVGNIVYIAFLASALRFICKSQLPIPLDLRNQSRKAYSYFISLLDNKRSAGLWAFQPDYIPTTVDTAFVCLSGLLPAWDTLEFYLAPNYGYYPQILDIEEVSAPYSMSNSEVTQHWHYIDITTTVYLESLRLKSGLDSFITEDWILEHFESRTGLFIANDILSLFMISHILPYLPDPLILKERIYIELSSYRWPDGSFSSDHQPSILSNALAALVLHQLGFSDNWVASAQMHAVLAFEDGVLEEPFFCSTTRHPHTYRSALSRLAERFESVRLVHDSYYSLTLYCDYQGIALLSVLAMALSCDSCPEVMHLPSNGLSAFYRIQPNSRSSIETVEDLCFIALERSLT